MFPRRLVGALGRSCLQPSASEAQFFLKCGLRRLQNDASAVKPRAPTVTAQTQAKVVLPSEEQSQESISQSWQNKKRRLKRNRRSQYYLNQIDKDSDALAQKPLQAVAYNTASSYNLDRLSRNFPLPGHLLYQQAFEVLKDLTDDVHYSKFPLDSDHPERDLFVFENGTVVIWGVPEEDDRRAILKAMQPCEVQPIPEPVTDHMLYRYGRHPEVDTTGIVLAPEDEGQRHILQQKLAYSWGLSRSVKLEWFENEIEKTAESIPSVLEYLKHDAKPIWMQSVRNYLPDKERRRLTRVAIAQVQELRAAVNLRAGFLEEPEVYWNDPKSGQLFHWIEKELEIKRRKQIAENHLQECYELLNTVREQLQSEHSTRLEWIIILLISLEVLPTREFVAMLIAKLFS